MEIIQLVDIFVCCVFVGVAYFIVNVKYLCSTVGIRGVVFVLKGSS